MTAQRKLMTLKNPAASALRWIEEFENAAIFLRLGLPSTLIRHEKQSILKTLCDRKNLKTLAYRFRAKEKRSANRGFRKPLRHDNRVNSLTEFFLKHKSKLTNDCRGVFKFLRRSVEGKHCMCFQSEISLSVVWTAPE